MSRQLIQLGRRTQELGAKPSGIYRGKLAEPYDGIGQYVSVALAGSSVGSAYKARVSAGDFGGGRTFPRGTPVTVFSFRGNLEVMLGNHPSRCTCGEPFSRVESVGLGTGPLGTWVPIDVAAAFSVDGENGVFNLDFNAWSTVTLASSIELPYESLMEYTAVGQTPFVSWSGTTAGGRSDFSFELNISEGTFAFPGIGISQLFLSGTFPNTVLSAVCGDDRSNLGGGPGADFDDVIPFVWPLTSQTVGPIMVRTYIDEYGSYARMWLKDSGEPLTMDRTTNPSDPFDVIGNVLHPYYWDAALEASFPGGKGEPWSAYDVNYAGKSPADAPGARQYTGFVVGGSNGHSDVKVADICIIRGGPC